MNLKTKPAASANAAGPRIGAFSWQATRFENRAAARGEQEAHSRAAEMRTRFAGRPYLIRYDADDPNWRVRALATLDPLSDAAFAVRAAPRTSAERVAFAVWAETEMQRIWERAA